MTLFVPAQNYVRQLEQMIEIKFRNLVPQEAEVFQHELQSVVDYNARTLSAYYPIYMESKE